MKNPARIFSALSPRAVIVALALTVGSTATFAYTDAQRQACTGDVFRLCSSDIPNVDKIIACLKRERAKVSAPCQSVMAAAASQTASAAPTRSMAPDQERAEWCAFAPGNTPGNTDASVQNWRTWCGSPR